MSEWDYHDETAPQQGSVKKTWYNGCIDSILGDKIPLIKLSEWDYHDETAPEQGSVKKKHGIMDVSILY